MEYTNKEGKLIQWARESLEYLVEHNGECDPKKHFKACSGCYFYYNECPKIMGGAKAVYIKAKEILEKNPEKRWSLKKAVKEKFKIREWYYYLHNNGKIIGKNPAVVNVNPEYFDSPFVIKTWHIKDKESVDNFVNYLKGCNGITEEIAEKARNKLMRGETL